jgi:hypothetical protein
LLILQDAQPAKNATTAVHVLIFSLILGRNNARGKFEGVAGEIQASFEKARSVELSMRCTASL